MDYNFFQTFHSHYRWLVFIFALVAIVLPFINQNDTISKKSKLPALIFMIVVDIQLLIGLILYFKFSPFGWSAFGEGMSYVMKNSEIRKIAVEHFTLMIFAWIMVHIGYSKVKKASSGAQIKKQSLIFFGIALVLILAGIPWARL